MRLTPLLTAARDVGPRAARAAAGLAPLVAAANPETLRQGRELVDGLVAARQGRSREERLRRTIGALREEAARSATASEEVGEQERAAGWVRQADALSTALALVGVRRGASRRRDLARITERVDALFAEVFTATVGDSGP